jgi:hypothetical protein
MTQADPAERPKRIDAFEAVFQVAQLAVRRMAMGWRPAIAAVVVLLPTGIGALVRATGAPGPGQDQFFFAMVSNWHFRVAVPVVALLFASGFPWPEAEEGTLTYWFTSPIRRWTVLLGRWIASLVVGSLVLCVGVVAIGLPLATTPDAQVGPVTRTALAATLLAFAAYLAVFQLVSTVFRRALVFGVVYTFVENFLSTLPGTISKLTLLHYARSLLWPVVPEFRRRMLGIVEPAPTVEIVATFVGVTVVALGLSLLLVELIEYRGRSSQPG